MPAPPASYSIDKGAARRNAEAAARGYLGAARLEQEVGARMLERLDYVKLAPKRLLDAGAGPSPQAAALAGRYPKAHLVALDSSLAMLQEATRRSLFERLTGKAFRTPVCADMERLPLAAKSFSLVWSNMALHWACDVQAALGEFHRVLEVEGLLMFSTLGPDTLKELRAAFALVGGPTRVHGFIDMHDLGDMLVAAGFDAPVMDAERITMTYPGVESLTGDLRATGQVCALSSRARGLLGARQWQVVRAALEKTMNAGRLPATIEVVYGHAWKPKPRVTLEGHAIVGLPSPKRMRN